MHTNAIREEFLANTVRECQALLAQGIDLMPHSLESAAGAFVRRLPVALTPVEARLQRGLLLELAIDLSRSAHHAFHRRNMPKKAQRVCGFNPLLALNLWPCEVSKSVTVAFTSWAQRYAAAFTVAHPQVTVRRAVRYVDEHFRERITVTELARTLECSPIWLQRTFREHAGKSLHEYQEELRLQEAKKLMCTTDWKIESIARAVGYRSKKDLYALTKAKLFTTPREFRRRHQGLSAERLGRPVREASDSSRLSRRRKRHR